MNPLANELKIDRDNLDEEWLRQPELYMKINMALAEARQYLDELKEMREVKALKLGKKVRQDPEAYGIEGRATDKAVNEIVDTDKNILAANEEVRQAKFEVDVLYGVLNSADHRRDALKNLTSMELKEWYGSSTGTVSSEDAKQYRAQKARSGKAAKSKSELKKRQ
jgi:hypothetical protein